MKIILVMWNFLTPLLNFFTDWNSKQFCFTKVMKRFLINGVAKRLNQLQMNIVGLYFFFPLLSKASLHISSQPCMNSRRTKTRSMSERYCEPHELTHSIWYHFWPHISSYSFFLLSIAPTRRSLWELWQLSQYHHFFWNRPPPQHLKTS